MAIKLQLTSKEILEKEFKIAPRGYDALQVDEFMDKILKDYRNLEECVVLSNDEMKYKNDKIASLEKVLNEKKILIAKYESRLEGIMNNKNATLDNADLLKRIANLENFLYKEGYDPFKIK